MTNNVNDKKITGIIGIVLAAILAVLIIIPGASYIKYKKGQKIAVEATIETVEKFRHKEDEKGKELVEDMYSFYRGSAAPGKATKVHNDIVYDLNRELGELLTESGYKCHLGTEYLFYTSFGRYISSNAKYWAPLVIWFVLAVVFVVLTLNKGKKKPAKQKVKEPEDLLKYKELFDKGAITAEEYEEKKKQILNL